jgi:hypothetical protein
MRPTGLSVSEPPAERESCGRRGTVGVATRTDADGMPLEVHRFCESCWPEQAARLRARWDEETRLLLEGWIRQTPGSRQPPARGAVFESATWHQSLEFVRMINLALKRGDKIDGADLRQIARDIERDALSGERVGQIPLEVEVFMRTHGVPPVSDPP